MYAWKILLQKPEMINETETYNQFQYYAHALTGGSNKPIITNCDYCGARIEISNKIRNKSNKHCDKDACHECRYKKRTEVSLNRDGVSNSAQRTEVRQKLSELNSERLKSDEYKARIKEIMKDRYGATSALQVPELAEKQRETTLKRHGARHIMQVESYREEATKKGIQTRIQNGSIKLYDGKTRPQIAREQGFSRSHFGKMVAKHGIDYALSLEKGRTYIEDLIAKFLTSLKIEYREQFRVENRIADFRAGNVIIECDGLRWHSDLYVPNNYHIEKRALYLKHGYRPLFFRENELKEKFEIVKSILLNSLNLCPNKVGARKLVIGEVLNKQAREFIQENHLMGPSTGVSNSCVLFQGDEILAILQMKRGKDNHYEIGRFCSKLNYSISGAFTRLLNYFIKTYKPAQIHTFIDLRYGAGGYLEGLGFKKVTEYPSFMWTDGASVFHRMKYKGNSGYVEGLNKIWDCGQAKYMLAL